MSVTPNGIAKAKCSAHRTGTFILHVPYRGGGPALSDLIAGHVQLSFLTVLEDLTFGIIAGCLLAALCARLGNPQKAEDV